MTTPAADMRWQQRFSDYRTALSQLVDAVALGLQRPLSRLERLGLIRAFEFTHELAWNTLKDIAEYQGMVGLVGSRDATHEAVRAGLLDDDGTWLEMILSRDRSAHSYDESTALEIERKVADTYLSLFLHLEARLQERLDAGN